MSYINDALHKARKDKEKTPGDVVVKRSLWVALKDRIAADSKRTDTWQKWYTVIGLSIAFLYAAGIIVAIYWSDIKPKLLSAPVTQAPVRVVAPPVALPAQQAPPQVSAPAVTKDEAPQGLASPADTQADKLQTSGMQASAANEKEPEKIEKPVLLKSGKPDESAVADPKSLYAQALQKQRDGKLDDAKELYKQVIKKEPRNIQAHNNLGVVYLKMKRYKWAAIRLNDAIRIKPDYVDAHYNLACLYAQKNDTKKSLSHLQNAIEFNPDVRIWAAQDSDFKALSNTTEFKNLIRAQEN
jgi:tetratricopeptide (TPR) repeat protein